MHGDNCATKSGEFSVGTWILVDCGFNVEEPNELLSSIICGDDASCDLPLAELHAGIWKLASMGTKWQNDLQVLTTFSEQVIPSILIHEKEKQYK